MSSGFTCERCRHWDAERLRVMPGYGALKLQAPCRVDAPTVVASPWRWQWDKACQKFAPEPREPTTTERAA